MMLEVLRDPVWQGIGVFIAVISALLAVIGLRRHRENVRYEEGYAERERRFTEVVSRLQELLTENELPLQLWANPSGSYQEEQGEEAKKSYNTLLRYYRANTIWLDRRSSQKIQDLLSKTCNLLTDFTNSTDPDLTVGEWNRSGNLQTKGEMRSSVYHRAFVELPDLRREIEEWFRQVLQQRNLLDEEPSGSRS